MIKNLIPFFIEERRAELYDYRAPKKYWNIIWEGGREYRVWLSGIPFYYIDTRGGVKLCISAI